jgi:hypothetical protein
VGAGPWPSAAPWAEPRPRRGTAGGLAAAPVASAARAASAHPAAGVLCVHVYGSPSAASTCYEATGIRSVSVCLCLSDMPPCQACRCREAPILQGGFPQRPDLRPRVHCAALLQALQQQREGGLMEGLPGTALRGPAPHAELQRLELEAEIRLATGAAAETGQLL